MAEEKNRNVMAEEQKGEQGILTRIIFVLAFVTVCLAFVHVINPDFERFGGHGRGVMGLMVSIFNAEEIAKTNAWLESLPVKEQPVELLKWVNKTISPGTWVQFTSFGPSGIVVTDLLSKLALLNQTKVIMIDTLHLFPETYDLMEKARDYFKLHTNGLIFRCAGASSRADFERQYGARIWRAAPKAYDFLTKIEPTRRALDQLGVQAWFTGRRRSQGGGRESLPLLEIDRSDGRLKMNPLINWPLHEVWAHIRSHKLPYNALHDAGYTSVGDMVTTVKTSVADGERGGRWKGESKSECGMHLAHDASSLYEVSKMAERVRKGYLWDETARVRSEAAGVVTVTEDKFEQILVKEEGHVVVKMYAPWCPHCQEFEVNYNAISHVFRNGNLPKERQVRFARMDRWQNNVPQHLEKLFAMDGFPRLFLLLNDCKERPIEYSPKEGASDTFSVEQVMAWIQIHLHQGCIDFEQEAFNAIDSDKSQQVSAAEVYAFVSQRGVPLKLETASAMLSHADDDASGEVDLGEFKAKLKYMLAELLDAQQQEKEKEKEKEKENGGGRTGAEETDL